MKRLLCAAAVLATALALARADEGAYRSLVGMASVAGSDRRAEDAAVLDGARSTVSARGASASDAAGGTALADTLRDALAEPPAPRAPAPRRPAEAAAAPAASPRLWSRLYSTLSPSWRKVPVLKGAYEAPASSASAAGSRPASALMPPPDSEAVKAGERRGLEELLSSSVAP